MTKLYRSSLLLATALFAAACASSNSGGSAGGGGEAGSGGSGGSAGQGGAGGQGGVACAEALCGGKCCSAGTACVNGACCAKPCASQCCGNNATCVQDAAGNESCMVACADASGCPASAKYCVALQDAQGAFAGGGCFSDATGMTLLCANASHCLANQACAPNAASDVPVGPFICKPNDGTAWGGCNGSVTCGTGYDCWLDVRGNSFCARSCTSAATCGAGATCNRSMACNNAVFGCGGPGGCVPQ